MKAPMPMPLAAEGEMMIFPGGVVCVEVGCWASVFGFGLVVSGEFGFVIVGVVIVGKVLDLVVVATKLTSETVYAQENVTVDISPVPIKVTCAVPG